MSYSIKTITKNDLYLLKPLWQKLNEIHLSDSPHFKDFYKTFTFEQRIVSFDTIIPDNMLIQIVEDAGKIFGFCISAITNETGEIESLFLEESVRGINLGETLCRNAIDWMKKRITQTHHQSYLNLIKQYPVNIPRYHQADILSIYKFHSA